MTISYNSTSPYYKTTKKNSIVQYLDVWKPRFIVPDNSDIPIIITEKYRERPDLLSYQLYGTRDFWWVFIVRNPNQIKDPIYDMVPGLEIFAPTKERLFSSMGG
jgi:hypothetical protein